MLEIFTHADRCNQRAGELRSALHSFDISRRNEESLWEIFSAILLFSKSPRGGQTEPRCSLVTIMSLLDDQSASYTISPQFPLLV